MAVSPTQVGSSRASKRQIADWRKLLTKKGRKEAGQILLEGVRLVSEAINSRSVISALIIANDDHGESAWRQLNELTEAITSPVYSVSSREFDQLADTVHAAGIACVMEWSHAKFDARSAKKGVFRALVCDQISDPGNLGTLIRTAAGLGLDAVFLLVETVELTNPKTVRSAAGAIFYIPVYEEVELSEFANWCSAHGITILVADPHRGKPIDEHRLDDRWAVVIGGETRGLSPQWDSTPAEWISLPLARSIESLNAAIAGAILMDRLCRHSEGNSEAKHP